MTREEAILCLKGIKNIGRDMLTEQKDFQECLDMAIKALEQERIRSAEITQYRHDCEKLMEENERLKKAIEQEPCNDVIGRAEAMTEIMMFAGNVKPDEENIYIKVSDAVELLRELPPVTQKPKIGHWIDMDEGFSPCECSECEAVEFKKSNYCPNCGAKMLPTDSEKE